MVTDRLIIDTIKAEDKLDYFNNISHDKKVLETFICTYQEDIESFNFEKYINREDILAIRLKDSGKLIGILSTFNNNDGSVEIGYGIGSAYWNKGYATEAVKTFVDSLLKKYDTVFASYFKGNIASKRVMEKVEMTYSHTNFEELEDSVSLR